jgi:hypothetical protein
MTMEKLNKQSLLYLGIVVVITIFVCLGIFYYFFYVSAPETTVDRRIFKELRRQKIVDQLEKLEASKEEIPPLSSEEIQRQLKELNKIR